MTRRYIDNYKSRFKFFQNMIKFLKVTLLSIVAITNILLKENNVSRRFFI